MLLAGADTSYHHSIARLLGNNGYEVQPASDAGAAAAAAKRHKPDIILAGMALPQHDGPGLIGALRQDPALLDVPIIIVSVIASEMVRSACLRAGADDYLVWPHMARDLLGRLASHLASARFRAAEIAAMSRLYALSCRLTTIPDLPSLLDEVLNSTMALQGADFGSLQLYDPETRSLSIAAQQGFGQEFLEYFRTVTVDGGSACARALKEDGRVIIDDVMLDPEFEPHRHIAAAAGFRAVQSTPLIERSTGLPIGMLSTHFREPYRPGARDLQWTDLYALQAGDVIALRLSAERLQKSEARLHAAVDLVGLSLYSWDPQTGALQWDEPTRAMWGLSPGAHVDHDVFLSGIHSEDRPLVDAAIARTIDPAGDGLYRAEYRVIGIGDGVQRWISAYGKTSFDKGKPVRHLGAALDITDRRRAEERAQQNEDRLRAALVASATGTWRWNIRTGAANWDEALDRLLGCPPEEAAHSLEEFVASVHPEDRPEFERRLERCIQENTDFEMEYRYICTDGRQVWLYDRGRMFRDSEGRPSYMTGACVDITERKHTEQVLRQSEERFRQFARHSTDVLRIIDLGTMRHAFISTAFERVWGKPVSPEWSIRDWCDTIHPADTKRVAHALERVQGGEDICMEYRIFRPDGGVRRLRETVFPIRDEHGRIGRVGSSAQDITHFKGSQVYLIDADPTSRLEVTEILQGAGHAVKTFASARTFLEMVSVLLPGCVIVDTRRAEAGDLAIPLGLKARRRELPVIIIADSGRDARSGVRAVKAGAADFLPFPFRREDLLTAVATELADIQESTAQDRDAELARAGIAALSARERQVLDGMLAGGTSKSIAKELGLSPRTIEMHRTHMMERLRTRTLLELVLLATAAGLKPLPAAHKAGLQMDVTGNETTLPIG